MSINRYSPNLFVFLLGMASCNSFAEQLDSGHIHQEPILPVPATLNADMERAAIGELLFNDTRLSSDGQFSCASCHSLHQGGDDNLQFSLSSTTDQNTINTPTVFNAVFNFRQLWDGSLKNSEMQVEHSITSQHEFNNNWDHLLTTLSGDRQLLALFDDAYADGLNRANMVNAIVEYQKTLITPNSRFDRYLRNEDDALTDKELAGYRLFKESGCVSCHQGINVGGNLFQKFGVFYDYMAQRGDIQTADFGRMNVTNRQVDKHVFKVPGLRNVELTAPYLHDGSAETLEDAIYIMGQTQLGRDLSDQEIGLIKSFLLTLTGEFKGDLLQDLSTAESIDESAGESPGKTTSDTKPGPNSGQQQGKLEDRATATENGKHDT